MGCSAVTSSSETPISLTEDPLLQLQRELHAQSTSTESSLQACISSLRLDIAKRETHCSELEQSIDSLRLECEDLRRCKTELSEVHTALAVKEQIVTKLESAVLTATEEIAELRRKVEDFEEMQRKAAVYQKEIRTLNESLAVFQGKEAQWGHDRAEFEQKIQALKLKQEVIRKAKRHYDSELSEKLVTQHIETRRLTDQVDSLTTQHHSLTEQRQKSLKRYTLTLFTGSFQSLQREAFNVWREIVRTKSEGEESGGNGRTLAVVRLAGVVRSGLLYGLLTWKMALRAAVEFSDTQSVSRSLSLASSELDCSFNFDREESPTAGNLFEKILNMSPAKWGSAMNKLKVVQLIEDLLDRKYEVDLASLADNAPIRSFAECISEYFTRKLGLARLAMKEIGVFLPGLSKLNREGNVAAVLFCRITNVFAEKPLPMAVSTFLVHARARFLNSLANSKKKGITKGKSEFLSPKKKKSDEEEMQLIEAIPLALDLFSKDRPCAERFLLLLKPEKVLHGEYVLFLLCYDITKQGAKVENLFGKLDVDKKGWLTPSQLAEGFAAYLKIWLNIKDLEQAFASIPPSKGKITAKELSKALKVEQFPMVRYSPIFSVTKTDFLIKLIATYTEMVDRNKACLREIYARHCAVEGKMTTAELTAALREISTSDTSDILFPSEQLSLEQFEAFVSGQDVADLQLGPFAGIYSESSEANGQNKSVVRLLFETGSPMHHKRSDSTASS